MCATKTLARLATTSGFSLIWFFMGFLFFKNDLLHFYDYLFVIFILCIFIFFIQIYLFKNQWSDKLPSLKFFFRSQQQRTSLFLKNLVTHLFEFLVHGNQQNIYFCIYMSQTIEINRDINKPIITPIKKVLRMHANKKRAQHK